MSKPTPNTRVDAIVRVVEDVIVVAGTGCTTWLATHNLDDTLGAVAAAPLVRSGVAAALSSGRVSLGPVTVPVTVTPVAAPVAAPVADVPAPPVTTG